MAQPTMLPTSTAPGPSTRHRALFGLAIALVAANIQPALASVGPVLADVRRGLALSGTDAAVLTAVPVLCFGAVAITAPVLARRWGMERVIAGALAVIGAGLLLRISAGTAALFTGTVVTCGALSIANVLLPAVIKRDFAGGGSMMLGVYLMTVTGVGALAAGATVPIGNALHLGWRGALGVWVLPVVVALAAWLPFTGARHRPPEPIAHGGSLLRDPLAWQVSLFFGLQALSFYAMLAWLPSVYRDQGFSPATAGLLLSASTLIQIPAALALPNLAARVARQGALTAAGTLVTAVGLAGVLLAPTTAPYLSMLLLGLGQGSTYAVGLTLFVLRSRTTAGTAQLGAMAQTCGYLLAAAGPLLVGAVHDVSGSWRPPLTLLLLLTVPQLLAGVLAGRNRYVGEDRDRYGRADLDRPADRDRPTDRD